MPYDPERHGPDRIVGPGFFERVYSVVARVPAGRVTTYGDVAEALGLRSVARKVGHALAALPADRDDVPWFRVVNSRGTLSRDPESPAGRSQAERLRLDGVTLHDGRIADFEQIRFRPD